MTGFVLKLVPDESMAAVLGDIINRLARMEGTLMSMQEKVATLAQKMSDLGTTVEAVLAKVQELKAAGGDETAVQGLIEQVDALNTALKAVVQPAG